MITFGICVGSDYIDYDKDNIKSILESINNTAKDLPYEVILVGNKEYSRYFFGTIYRESIDCFSKNAWITRKKNYLTDLASFDNIVYSHDYICYGDNFYDVVLNADFDIAVPIILNKDGSRYRDKISWGDPQHSPSWIQYEPFCPNGLYHEGSPRLEPYNREISSEYRFVNGTFWIAKKEIMQKYPLDNSLVWGQAEDCEWSYRWRKDPSIKLVYLLDTHVQSLIQKDLIYKYACY